MKKGYNKIMAICLSTIIASSLLSFNVGADQIYRTESSNVFSKAWEKTTSSGSLKLTYGFNTWAFNEDYSNSYHPSRSHIATVSNKKGSKSNSGNAGQWSGYAELNHTDGTITYTAQD